MKHRWRTSVLGLSRLPCHILWAWLKDYWLLFRNKRHVAGVGLIYHTCASIRRQAECQLQILHHLRTRFFSWNVLVVCWRRIAVGGGSRPLLSTAGYGCLFDDCVVAPVLVKIARALHPAWVVQGAHGAESPPLLPALEARSTDQFRAVASVTGAHRSLWRVDSVENFQPFAPVLFKPWPFGSGAFPPCFECIYFCRTLSFDCCFGVLWMPCLISSWTFGWSKPQISDYSMSKKDAWRRHWLRHTESVSTWWSWVIWPAARSVPGRVESSLRPTLSLHPHCILTVSSLYVNMLGSWWPQMCYMMPTRPDQDDSCPHEWFTNLGWT